MFSRLLVLTIATEALYLLLAKQSRVAPEESLLARFYHPVRVEETLAFFAIWAALFLAYALAIRTASAAKGRLFIVAVFLTSALFRASLFWQSGFDTEPPRAFLQSENPLAALGGLLERELSGREALESIARAPGRESPVRAATAILFDLAALALAPALLRRASVPAGLALVHGWNPLVVKEVAGNARVEVAALFFLLLAIRLAQKSRLSAAALVYGASLLGPPVLWSTLPLFAKALRLRLVLALAPAAAVWAWLAASSVAGWTGILGWPPRDFMGGSLLPAMATLSQLLVTRNEMAALAAAFLLFLVVAFRRTAKLRSDLVSLPRGALVLVGAFLALSPQVMPWAFLFIAALAAHGTHRGWLVLTATAPLTYLGIGSGSWSFWLGFAQYFPGYAALVYSWLGRERSEES